MTKKKYTFIDLFAGIGGFHTAMHYVGGKCVFASEWDKNARLSYEANYKDIEPELFQKDKDGKYLFFNEDINDAIPNEIPDFDICCGGFPCQPFSVAGLKRGFEDTRGTLFFSIANIIKEKINAGCPPKVLFLENVRGLKTHDKGNTLKVILATLEELGYGYSFEVLNAKYFGVPQNRERLFIIAWYKKQIDVKAFKFPYEITNWEDYNNQYSSSHYVPITVHKARLLQMKYEIDEFFNDYISHINHANNYPIWIIQYRRIKQSYHYYRDKGYTFFLSLCLSVWERIEKHFWELVIAFIMAVAVVYLVRNIKIEKKDDLVTPLKKISNTQDSIYREFRLFRDKYEPVEIQSKTFNNSSFFNADKIDSVQIKLYKGQPEL